MLNESGKEKAGALALAFDSCLATVKTLIGDEPSRELSLVKTHMELASFYSKKAMATKRENQQ